MVQAALLGFLGIPAETAVIFPVDFDASAAFAVLKMSLKYLSGHGRGAFDPCRNLDFKPLRNLPLLII